MNSINDCIKLSNGVHFKKDIYRAAFTTRQGYDKLRQQRKKQEVVVTSVIKQVGEIRKEHPKMGSRPLFYKCNFEDIGINRFERIVQEEGLCIPRKRIRITTTDGVHENTDHNLLKGQSLTGINQAIVGDITYFKPYNELYYIFTLKDAYSGRILSLQADVHMKAAVGVKALKEVSKIRGKEALKGCIHHTDAGSQYKSNLYKGLLKSLHMNMSISGNCLENGIAEQLNGVIKNDYLIHMDIRSLPQLKKALIKIIDLINNERPTKNLLYKTPSEYERYIESLPIDKRPRKYFYDFADN